MSERGNPDRSGEGEDPFAHPVAQLSQLWRHIWSYWADGLDKVTVLSRNNGTDQNPIDVTTRSLKVECFVQRVHLIWPHRAML